MRKKTCSLYEEVVKRANVLAPAPASPRSCSCARAHHKHHVPEGQVPLPARLWRVVDDREDVDDRPQEGARCGQLPEELAFEEIHKSRTSNLVGGPVDDDGNPLMDWHAAHPKTDLEKAIDDAWIAARNGQPLEYTTWKIPKDAPPGWGMGNGEKWLKENPMFPGLDPDYGSRFRYKAPGTGRTC